MKAVILAIAPDSQLVDLTHSIPAQDVPAGAMALQDAWPWLPERSVVCAVVDPGVGSTRRSIAAKIGKKLLVGPDNGLLAPIIEESLDTAVVVQIEAGGPIRPKDSATFHGRDVFAPAAALLASGTKFKKMGTEIDDWIRLDITKPVMHPDGRIELRVVAIDRFGNIATNLRRGDSAIEAPWLVGSNVLAGVGRHVVRGMSRTYADVPKGSPVLYWNSTNRLEIGINQGNAAKAWNVSRGNQVIVVASDGNRAKS